MCIDMYTIELVTPSTLSDYSSQNKEIHPHNTVQHKEDFHNYSVLSRKGKGPLKLKDVLYTLE